MITVYVHKDGQTEPASSIDRAWLNPGSGVFVWVDLAAPTIPESLILSDTFGFHPLSVEDAMSEVHFPKIEAYGGYLYLILHGIDFHAGDQAFATHDIDFFVGPNYLVTVHDGHSRSIRDIQQSVARRAPVMSEGPIALLHRVVDAMIERYRPEVEKLEERIEQIEKNVFAQHVPQHLVRQILLEKRQVSSLRRIITPQRDVVARLARREFAEVGDDVSFRFRDVYDQLVRIADDALLFQDRITGVLEAHLSNVSNRLNEVMKLLTVLTTVFLPLTLLSGLWGMNIPLPRFPGTDAAQFWWLFGIMVVVVAGMLALFRSRRWI
jgi:magnesium transporter